MENKKLLKYLLKDLFELEEMFAGVGKTSFDAMEMEFIRNRVSGAKKLVKIYLENDKSENEYESKTIEPQKTTEQEKEQETIKPEINAAESFVEAENIATTEVPEEINPKEEETENEQDFEIPAVENEEKTVSQKTAEIQDKVETHTTTPLETIAESPLSQTTELEHKDTSKQEDEVQLEEEEMEVAKNRRLGDSFSKERSVNDSMSDDFSKLEHKLSNRPVASLKTSIGINDKFQYIRELFEGSAESFTKAVEELDAMHNLKDAVQYLQTNYKWKKNETSLKFVNLIKRRFPNE